MGLRLPAIQFGAVQSLGRYDISAPMRTAAARTQAAMSVSNSMQKWASAEVERNTAEATTEYKKQLNDLKVGLLSSDVVDVAEYEDIDFDESDMKHSTEVLNPETGQMQTTIPTWRVINKIYDQNEKKLRSELSDPLGGVGKNNFNARVEGAHSSASNSIALKQINGHHAFLNGGFKDAYQTELNNSPYAGGREIAIDNAKAVAGQALATGAWSKEEYDAKMLAVESDIDYTIYSKQMQTAVMENDTETLDAIIQDSVDQTKNQMTPEKRLNIQAGAYTAKIKADKAVVAGIKKATEDTSKQRFANYSMQIRSGGVQSWASIDSMRKQLRPEEQVKLMTLNALAEKQVKKSHAGAMSAIQTEISALRIDIPGVERADRVKALENILMGAAGVDPATGRPTGVEPIITHGDYDKSLARIEQVTQAPSYSDMQRRIRDRIYRVVSGMPEKSFMQSSAGPDVKYRLNRALTKMEHDMDAAGAGWQGEQWWLDNTEMFRTGGFHAAELKVFERETGHLKIESETWNGIKGGISAIATEAAEKRMDPFVAERHIEFLRRKLMVTPYQVPKGK